MSKLKAIGNSGNHWRFYCPGCEENHQIDDTWDFNNDLDKPTFKPSYLTFLYPNAKALPEYDPTGKFRNGFRCHSFITDGNIEYLTDSTHKLAGQTVELPDLEDV